MAMQPSKIIWQCRCCVNTQKTNLRQFLFKCRRLQDSNFNRTGLHQANLLKKLNENNLAKVSFLKLLTKEYLLKCFHQFITYQKRPRIFFPSKFRRKKYAQTNWIFRPSKLRQKKYVETMQIFRQSKLHRKKYVEATWIF